MNPMGEKITVERTITGYHHYKSKPNDAEQLRLVKEPENKVDPWAIKLQRRDGTMVGHVSAICVRHYNY